MFTRTKGSTWQAKSLTNGPTDRKVLHAYSSDEAQITKAADIGRNLNGLSGRLRLGMGHNMSSRARSTVFMTHFLHSLLGRNALEFCVANSRRCRIWHLNSPLRQVLNKVPLCFLPVGLATPRHFKRWWILLVNTQRRSYCVHFYFFL